MRARGRPHARRNDSPAIAGLQLAHELGRRMLAIVGVSRELYDDAAREVDDVLEVTSDIQSGFDPSALEDPGVADLN